MKNFAAEFRDVISLYVKPADELAKILSATDSDDSRTLIHSVFQNQDCLVHISQMNSRIAKLSDDWIQCREHLDPAARDEADEMAAAAKAQAVRLQGLCLIHVQKLQTIHDGLRNNLAEIGKGARYAKGLKLNCNNYPKFIDSSY
jgi:hypothetical protein